MARAPAGGRREPDLHRAAAPAVALAAYALALIADPAGWAEAAVLVIALAALGLWAAVDVPALALTAAVVLPVAFAQRTGDLEPALFLVSVLALALVGWAPLRWANGAGIAIAVATPPVLAALLPEEDIAWPIWMVGIGFPAVMGWAFHRQERLAGHLERARAELAEQAVLEERRHIARDVHDLVGHGLAAMLLQVTSARHVLRRDPDAADEALRAAETAGRHSMGELRRTVALLRREDEGEGSGAGTAPPVPDLADLPRLVAEARSGGLAVEHRTSGDHGRVSATVGLALYRIAQEALANVGRHAPAAHTLVTTAVGDGEVTLAVESDGPPGAPRAPGPPGPGDERPRYGLRGMRERAEVAGGELWAGPTATGFLVRARVPL